MKLTFRQYLGIILVIIFFTCLSAALCSCNSSKHLETVSIAKEETRKLNIDSLVSLKVDSVKKKYDELLKTLDADIIFYNDCDTTRPFRDTGSTKVINTVKYIPGKGFEASGNILAFKLRESELRKSLDSFAIEYESESRLRATAEANYKSEQEARRLDKKTKVFNLWWLLFVGVAIGIVLESKYKLFHKVKSLLTKI